jgi:hypothetical protein
MAEFEEFVVFLTSSLFRQDNEKIRLTTAERKAQWTLVEEKDTRWADVFVCNKCQTLRMRAKRSSHICNVEPT